MNELVSLQNQVNEIRLQDKLGEQNYHHNVKKLYEHLTDTIKNTSENLTKTITETSINNNKALENLNEKVLELMNDKVMIAPYLASSLVNLFKPENKSQFRLTKDLNSIGMIDFLINTSIPVTLYSNMLTFGDSNKFFKLDGDLLETMTNYEFNVSHSNPQDQRVIFEFGKEMNFILSRKDEKVTEINLLRNYLNHLLSWLLEFQQYFYYLILMNFVID